LFGVRLGIALLRAGTVNNATELAAAYVTHSGIDALREALATQFRGRAGLLKARTALATLDQVLRTHPIPAAEDLAGELERIVASTHGFAEARMLNALRSGNVSLRDADVPEAERLLGGHGHEAAARLGIADGADPTTLRDAAIDATTRWQRRAEHPLASPEAAEVARHIVRSCEGLLVDLGQTPSTAGTPGEATGPPAGR
jgi:hypothetical protein